MKTYRVTINRIAGTGGLMGRSYVLKASRDGLAVDRALTAYERETPTMRAGDILKIVAEREA